MTMGPAGVIDADVAVDGSRITAIGTDIGRGDTEIDARGMFVIPGLVQAHVHLCQTLLRGMGEDLDVVDWLRERIWPAERAHDAASMRAACRLGIAELLSTGTTTALSMESVHHTDESFRAAEEMGIRAFIGKALMDQPEPVTEMVGESTDDALEDLTRLVEAWDGAAGGRLRVAVSPRTPRNVTPELWRACAEVAEAADLRLHTHVAENAAYADRVEATPEGRDLVALEGWGVLGPRLVMAHTVWLDEAERELLRWRRPHVCHCPSSNLKLASGIAPIPAYLDDGINVALGADGAACNNRLDGFAELRLAALLHKPRYGPRAMPAAQALAMATIAGARALGVEGEVGSLEPGKRADVVLVRRGGLGATPASGWGAAEQLVYSHTGADVAMTLVDGRVVWDGEGFAGADGAEIVAEAETARRALSARMAAGMAA